MAQNITCQTMNAMRERSCRSCNCICWKYCGFRVDRQILQYDGNLNPANYQSDPVTFYAVRVRPPKCKQTRFCELGLQIFYVRSDTYFTNKTDKRVCQVEKLRPQINKAALRGKRRCKEAFHDSRCAGVKLTRSNHTNAAARPVRKHIGVAKIN